MAITRIFTNSEAYTAAANIGKLENSMNRTLERLSTGLRINRGSDDPAGVATASLLKAKVSGLGAAIENVQAGVSLMNAADGALTNILDMLTRVRDIALQAGNAATATGGQLSALAIEAGALASGISRDLTNAGLGNVKFFTGLFTAGLTIAAGDVAAAGIELSIPDIYESTAGVSAVMASASVAIASGGASALNAAGYASTAIQNIANIQAAMGAQASRLNYALNGLMSERANQMAAQSRIVDADVAAEVANLATYQVRAQAGMAAIAQANAMPQMMMNLLNRL